MTVSKHIWKAKIGLGSNLFSICMVGQLFGQNATNIWYKTLLHQVATCAILNVPSEESDVGNVIVGQWQYHV